MREPEKDRNQALCLGVWGYRHEARERERARARERERERRCIYICIYIYRDGMMLGLFIK